MKLPTMEQETVLLKAKRLFKEHNYKRWSFSKEELCCSLELLQELCEKNWLQKSYRYFGPTNSNTYALTGLGRKTIYVNRQLEISFSQ